MRIVLSATNSKSSPSTFHVTVTVARRSEPLPLMSVATLKVMGTPAFFVGLGQPDERTEALTGHAAVRV